MATRDERAEWDESEGKPGPPKMFRLPVIGWDPIERERQWVSQFLPADLEDGKEYEMSEEDLAGLVPRAGWQEINARTEPHLSPRCVRGIDTA